MNIQKIALAFIIFFLFAACLIQTSMLGCSKTEAVSEESVVEETDDGPTFFSRLGSGESGEIFEWTPVSENVIDQVEDMFEDTGVVVASIERGQAGSRVVRCTLESRNGVSIEKQLFDGMRILHDTYPEQNRYFVGLSGNESRSLEADWTTLVKFVEENGYSFDTSPGEAERLWSESQSDYIPDEKTAEAEDSLPFIQVGS